MAAMAVMTTFQLTAFFLVPYCVLMALGVQGLQVGDVVASAAFILMISSFVPLPGASGGAEGSFYVFFQMFFKCRNFTVNFRQKGGIIFLLRHLNQRFCIFQSPD